MAETILKKNFAHIEGEIAKLKKVPPNLYEDADQWTLSAKEKLDLFEQNMDQPNFINYDMIESKDPNAGPDICIYGEQLFEQLEQFKDIS